MSKTKRPKYCWDSSVFLGWLNQDKSAPLNDIALVIEQITKNQAILLVAVTTYTEIVRAKHSAEQLDLFDRFLERSNVRRIDTTFPIARKAEEIRSCPSIQPSGEDLPMRPRTAYANRIKIDHWFSG